MSQELTQKLHEFYSTNDSLQRAALNQWLMEFQESDSSWNICCNVLQQFLHSQSLTPSDTYLALFALNCLHRKLTVAGFFEKHVLESNCDDLEPLGDFFVKFCEKVHDLPALRLKSCACLADYLLKTMPDVVEQPFQLLRLKWLERHPDLLMDVFGVLVTEFRLLAQPLPRRNNVRSFLRQNEAFVANCAAELLQSPLCCDRRIVEAAISCVESWLSMDGTDLCDWQAIIILCLSEIGKSPRELIGCVCRFFETFVEHPQLYRMERFLKELFDYAGNLVQFAQTLHHEDDLFDNAVHMIEVLCSNHTKVLVKLIIIDQSETARKIIDFFLSVSNTPGWYARDETVSILPVNFWYHLYEEANSTTMDYELARSFYNRVFQTLIEILVRKSRLSNDFDTLIWSADEREQFEYYRTQIADTVTCCYRILNTTMSQWLLGLAREILSSSLSSLDDLMNLEAVLFIITCIGDYVTVDDQPIVTFLREILVNLQLPLLQNDRLLDTVCEVTEKYAALLIDHEVDSLSVDSLSGKGGSIDVIDRYFKLIGQFLHSQKHVNQATNALRDSCAVIGRAKSVTPTLIVDTVQTATACFDDATLSGRHRLRALGAACLLVAGQSKQAVVIGFLDRVLGPRMQRLAACANNPSQGGMTKDEMLFEFDVISTLIGSLKQSVDQEDTVVPVSSSDGNNNPALLVTSQSLQIFASIYASSSGDPDIAGKLCDALMNCLATLMIDLKPVLDQMCSLIKLIYPPHFRAINVAGKILLIFSTDASVGAITKNLFLHLMTSSINNADTEALAEFMSVCLTLVKKTPRFFDQSIGLDSLQCCEIACQCIESQDGHAAKQAALFLAAFFKLESSQLTQQAAELYGPKVITVCLKRLKTEISTALVNHVADTLFVLFGSSLQFVQIWQKSMPILKHEAVQGLFRDFSNKMKCREVARQLNLNCRKGLMDF